MFQASNAIKSIAPFENMQSLIYLLIYKPLQYDISMIVLFDCIMLYCNQKRKKLQSLSANYNTGKKDVLFRAITIALHYDGKDELFRAITISSPSFCVIVIVIAPKAPYCEKLSSGQHTEIISYFTYTVYV